MKLIRRLLFVFFLISPFANLHNLNASEPGPLEAAGGAGGGTDWMPQELTYEIVKGILDTQDITEWNTLLRNYGISTIQDAWRAGNRTESMLDYSWKKANEKTGKMYKYSSPIFTLISQAMTSNEFIKDAIHTQDLAALKYAICNVFGDLDNDEMSDKAVSEAVLRYRRPLTLEEYEAVCQKALNAFYARTPSHEECKEALMRWNIEYPFLTPDMYTLNTCSTTMLTSDKICKMDEIIDFFRCNFSKRDIVAAATDRRPSLIYNNIKQAIDRNLLKVLQICRKNYSEPMIISAWKKHHSNYQSPALYAISKGKTEPYLLDELARYTPAFPQPLVVEDDAELLAIEKDYNPTHAKRSYTPPIP